MKKYWFSLVLGLLVPLLVWFFWPNPNDFAGHGFLETIFANNLLVALTRTVFVLVTCFAGYSIIVQLKDGKVLTRLWEMGEREKAGKTLAERETKNEQTILFLLKENEELREILQGYNNIEQKVDELRADLENQQKTG